MSSDSHNPKILRNCPHGYQITPTEPSEKKCIKCGFVALRNELSVLRYSCRSADAAEEAKLAIKGRSISPDEIPARIWEVHCNLISALEEHQEHWESKWGFGRDLLPKEAKSIFEVERELALWYNGQHIGPEEWPIDAHK